MARSVVDRGFQKGLGGFFTGALTVLWGLRRLSSDKELRGLAIIPLGLTTLVYSAIVGGVVFFTPKLLEWVRPEDPAGWQVGLWWALVVVTIIGLLAVAAILFTAVVELVGGPFYDKMATQILDQHGIGSEDPGFVKGSVPDLFRSLLIAVPAVFCWVLGFIPVVGIFFWILGLLIAWFGLGASAINPPLLLTGLPMSKRVGWFLRYLPTTLGMGAVVAASMLVPFLGLVTIPGGVIGASALFAKTPDRPDV